SLSRRLKRRDDSASAGAYGTEACRIVSERMLRQRVSTRAGERCEYCRLPEAAVPLITFHVEHIIPRQHGGGDDLSNRANACPWCNRAKGPNLSGLDKE